LCGIDDVTGRDFSHRRQWIEHRIQALSEIFTVSIYAYAVMSNHYHIVLSVEPTDLTDEEVAAKWLQLCPVHPQHEDQRTCHEARKAAIVNDPKKLAELRARLRSLSWFMRFLNEPLARIANKEDSCTGRFWEGRFKSQKLLDEASVLACMVYVDLNPVRAGIADNLADSEFTSVRYRLTQDVKEQSISAINGSNRYPPFAQMSLAEYLSLVRWTAASQLHTRRSIHSQVHHCLRNNHITRDSWFRDHLPQPDCWQRAIGSIESLRTYAKSIGQCWIKRRSPRIG